MSIYLHEVNDVDGDLIDLVWFDSADCYRAEIGGDPYGHRYPCGMESDSPDFCAHCGEAIGNPLTDDGRDYAREIVADGGEYAATVAATYNL